MAEMEITTVRVVGMTPLLLNSPAGMVANSGKPKVRQIPTPQEEAETGTYRLDDGQLYLPMAAFRAAVVEAAKGRRVGRMGLSAIIKGAVFTTKECSPLWHPETKEALREYEVDVRRAVPPKQGAVMRARARLEEWAAEAEYEFDPEFISLETIQDLMQLAGRRVGVGSYRPQKGGPFGRFELA